MRLMTTRTLDDPAAIAAVTHPVRAAILAALREPSTAAAVARVVGQSRQNVAYHVRELEKVGLVRHVGQRQKGNFLEQRYVAVAASFLVAPAATWGDPTPRADALADQLSLAELHAAGQQLQRDSAELLDRAAFDGDNIPSASVVTDLRFDSEAARAAFLRAYVDAVRALVQEHGSRRGTPYRVLLAAYPTPEEP
jgi:DNA-binding transcriptional ArsR family regulator